MKGRTAVFYVCLVIAIIGLGAYGVFIEPDMVEIQHLRIDDKNLKDVLNGKTAIHISDLHISNIGKLEKKILSIIKKMDPDFIFLTGDYVKWKDDYEPAMNFLFFLRAKIGVWAVMGDYDYSNSRRSCLFCHEQGTGKSTKRHAVKFLRNSVERINLPNGLQVSIGGIDAEANDHFEINDDGIVLSHSPLAFDRLDNDKNVLMLAGDTHGGQVPVPSWLWQLLGYEKNARYNSGFYQVGRKMMYVSKGIGTSHIPIRIFRRPEIVVIHF
jgi:uncharacterized protein